MSVLQSKVDLAATVPFDSLSWIATCDTTTTGLTKIVGCTTVTSQSARLASIQIIVHTTVPGGRPDTINMQRGKPRIPIPIT